VGGIPEQTGSKPPEEFSQGEFMRGKIAQNLTDLEFPFRELARGKPGVEFQHKSGAKSATKTC